MLEGAEEGTADGSVVGEVVGLVVGLMLGKNEGLTEGRTVGSEVGELLLLGSEGDNSLLTLTGLAEGVALGCKDCMTHGSVGGDPAEPQLQP